MITKSSPDQAYRRINRSKELVFLINFIESYQLKPVTEKHVKNLEDEITHLKNINFRMAQHYYSLLGVSNINSENSK